MILDLQRSCKDSTKSTCLNPIYPIVVVQSLSRVQLFRDPMDCSTPGFPFFHCLLEFAQTHVYWVSDAIQPSDPLSPLLLLSSIFPSIRVLFSSESVLCIRWPKYWSFSINPSNEYSGLIYFRIDWFDLFAIIRTLKSVRMHQFFSAQPSLWSNSHIHTWLLEKQYF